jgi:hypothetical protein
MYVVMLVKKWDLNFWLLFSKVDIEWFYIVIIPNNVSAQCLFQ